MTDSRVVDLQHMPLVLAGRPRKRWRYVGVFGSRLMLCAGVVQIGPALQTFWAVWDRERRALRERTRLWRPRPYVRLGRESVSVDDGSVSVRLRLEPGVPIEAVSDVGDGRAWIWTRKQGAVRFTGTVVLDGEEIEVDALGCVDESAGYHARRTDWDWSAGVGELVDGRPVGWNLVRGIHDAETGSERAVWVSGVPSEPPPVVFAPDLSSVDGLSFVAEATRARRDDFGVFRSDYVQPFGTFSGTLPGSGLELAEGFGVMERHSALW